MQYTHTTSSIILAMVVLFAVGVFAQSFTKIEIGAPVTDGGHSVGCSWNDYDGDGDLDLYVTNGIVNGNEFNFFYINNGDASFTAMAGSNIVSEDEFSESATWGDINNDGNADLFVANSHWGLGSTHYDQLFVNDGSGDFTQVLDGEVVTTLIDSRSASWGDFDNDGYLDLFIANENGVNYLYKNDRSGRLSRVYMGELTSDDNVSAGCEWVDYDLDGDLDMFVTNLNGQNNQLYRNEAGLAFTKITSGAIVEDGGNSIGCSWGDYTGDGFPDLFVANFGNQNNFVYTNNGDDSFTKLSSGAVVEDGGQTFGSAWADYDNDGDLDLFATNLSGQDNFFYRNDNGTLVKVNEGTLVSSAGESEGCAWGDYDNDGDLDLFVANFEGENNFLYANDGNQNSWLNLTLNGVRSNTSAIGARIGAFADGEWQYRQISAQTGYQSQNSHRVHFGFGTASAVDSVKIWWPSGIVQVLADVQVDQFLTVAEQLPEHDIVLTSSRPLPDMLPGHVLLAPEFRILNGGSQAAESIAVVCQVDSSSVIVYEETIIVAQLASLQSETISFAGHALHGNSEYRVTCYAVYAPDSDDTNNHVERAIELSSRIDDFEHGLNTWELEGDWGLGSSAFAGIYSLDNSPRGNYANDVNIAAEYAYSIDLSTVEFATINFWSRFLTGAGDDYGVLEVSTDGGESWVEILSPLSGIQVEWEAYEVDLAPYVGAGNSDLRIRFRFISDASGSQQGWWIDDLHLNTDRFMSLANEARPPVSDEFELFQNYPNPFNPSTLIRYELVKRAEISLSIYDVSGRRVTTLIENIQQPPSSYEVVWDGTDSGGSPVASGIYFYSILVGDGIAHSRKMILLR